MTAYWTLMASIALGASVVAVGLEAVYRRWTREDK